ncbi:MAG: metal ABC transporter ATP-binding protein [Desulfobacterales bacterium]|nr:metal ABC transporter ATP-binding protein [Desulfobacterales bacterium]
MRTPVIEIKDLWFAFNKHLVLKAVNLTIYPNEFLALIGPNGGGKTTLIKLMLGLLKTEHGKVLIFGQKPKQVAHLIGYVPQDVRINTNFPISVHDVVLMGRLHPRQGWVRYSRKDHIIVQNALEKLGMWQYRNERIKQLSGGQRQRAFIARALAVEPEILFLDEPIANVDTKGQTEIFSLLKDLNKSITILVVSHDFMVLSSYIKAVACVNQRVHFHAAAEITDEMLEMAYHCPVELIAHGIPHRVLRKHEEH